MIKILSLSIGLIIMLNYGFSQNPLKTKEEIVANLIIAGKNVLELEKSFPIYRNGSEDLYITLHCSVKENYLNQPDKVQIWKIIYDINSIENYRKYKLIYEFKGEGEGLDYIDDISEFNFGNYRFLKIEKVYYGSGHDTDMKIIHITSQGEIKDVEIESATDYYLKSLKPGEYIGKGEMRDFRCNSLNFCFSVYCKGDANCCPTGGTVSGNYKLITTKIDDKENYKLVVDKITRFVNR